MSPSLEVQAFPMPEGPLSNRTTMSSGGRRSHSNLVISQWEHLTRYINDRKPIIIDGSTLDIAATTAVGRYGIPGALSTETAVLDSIHESVQFLNKHMAQGNTVYGNLGHCHRLERC